MATFIPADAAQPTHEVSPKDPEAGFTLEELYPLLSCTTIEVVSLPDGQMMIIDEEGKWAQKPRNERATQAAQFVSPKEMVAWLLKMREQGVNVIRVTPDPLTDCSGESDWIVGDALICHEEELK